MVTCVLNLNGVIFKFFLLLFAYYGWMCLTAFLLVFAVVFCLRGK